MQSKQHYKCLYELGPICSKNGITSSMLLMYPLNHVRLPEVETITNELVLELSRFKDRHSQCTFKTLHEWIRAVHGSIGPQEAPTYQAISKSIDAKYQRLKRREKVIDEQKTQIHRQK